MQYHSQFVDRVISFCLYTALILPPLWIGGKAINLAHDQMFITRFLFGWEQVVLRLQAEDVRFPSMQSRQLVFSMDRVAALAKRHMIDLPQTNTNRSYAHHLSKISGSEQKIFLIVDRGRIIVYGLRKQTLQRIDKRIDGTLDLNRGHFRATPGKSANIYTGIWTL